jgi:transposase
MRPGPKLESLVVPRGVARELKRVARRALAPQRDVMRARIVLLAKRGVDNASIGRRVGCTEKTARKWRRRFDEEPSVDALLDRRRSGRPPRVRPDQRAHLIKLACDRPKDTTFRDVWTYGALGVALRKEIGCALSESEIGRILRAEEIRPHRLRLWLHSPDPDFDKKVKRICALYTNPPKGTRVICVDEKTCIQALERKFVMRPADRGRDPRVEFEYKRHGTRALIAGLDVASGEVLGHLRKRRTADDLIEFLEALAKRYPTGIIYIVWDNLNIHYDGKDERWTRFNRRHRGRFRFVYTPKHASWVNQIEIWFSILHRRVLKHGHFRTAAEMVARINGFIAHWNRKLARPFRWTFRGTCKHAPRQLTRRTRGETSSRRGARRRGHPAAA